MRTVLLLVLLLPAAAPLAAQLGSEPAPRRVSVSAFTGVRVPYSTGFVTVFGADGAPLYSVSEQRGGNVVLGVDADIRVAGRLSALVGATYSQAGISDYFVQRQAGFRDTADFRVRFTDEMLFAKAGASLRLEAPRRPGEARLTPATDLFAAAAVVRQLDTHHPALNFGFKGAFPLNRRGVELVVGVEDFLVFWDQDALAPVVSDLLRPAEEPVGVQFLYETSNVVLLRAGVSLRF